MIRPGTPRRAEALRWLGALLAVGLPLVLGQQTPARVTQDFGRSRELPNVTGLQAPEQGEDGPFRWGGEQVTMRATGDVPPGVRLALAVYQRVD